MFSEFFKRFFVQAVFLVFTVNAHAQLFPVQVTPQLIPPYSVYLSDYATSGNDKLRVIVLQRDLSRPAYQIRLVMTVELNNKVIIRTSRAFNPGPINLSPGIPMIISGAELAPYLNSRNMDFVGYDRNQYEKTRALPEGQYRISFTAYDYYRQDVPVSAEGNAFYYLSKNEPPLINYPSCGTKIAMKTPQQIIFSWLPRNTASPNSVMETEYEFSLYETRPTGRNPNDVVLTSQPVFRTRTNLTQLIYGPGEPMLLKDMTYVWRVQAIDINGKDAFRNNGYSEVCTFYYGGNDINFEIGVVKDLQALGETKNRGKIWWTPEFYDSYRLEYKKTGQGFEWFKSDTKSGEIKIFDLEPDTEYEARVQARKSGYFGPYSDIVKFRTLPNRPAQCGENPDLPDRNNPGKPLTGAITGMNINARGVEMTLLSVTSLDQPGWYKGVGRITLDYFLGLSYGATFDKIYINENREVVFGRIDVLTEGMASLIEQQIEANKNKTATSTSSDPQWENVDFYDKVFEYNDIEIKSVSTDADGNIVITDNSGNTIINTEIPAIFVNAPEKAVIIEDKNGDQWVVQKDQSTGKTKITKVEGGGLPRQGALVDASKLDDFGKMLRKVLLEIRSEDSLRITEQADSLNGFAKKELGILEGFSSSANIELGEQGVQYQFESSEKLSDQDVANLKSDNAFRELMNSIEERATEEQKILYSWEKMKTVGGYLEASKFADISNQVKSKLTDQKVDLKDLINAKPSMKAIVKEMIRTDLQD